MKQAKSMSPAIFLDRDGTIIYDKVYLNDPTGVEYLPGSIEGLRKFKNAGFKLIVVTNQSGLARGIVDIRNLDLIHQKMTSDLAKHGVFISGFYYSPYSIESGHMMRKPNPGMILCGSRDHNIVLSKSWMIGDRWVDVEAGRRAGCKSVQVGDTVEITPPEYIDLPESLKFNDLSKSADYILGETGLQIC